MKPIEQIEGELDRLLESQYYAEDYELRALLGQFANRMEPHDLVHFHTIALRRLQEDPSILTVALCAATTIPGAERELCSLLDRQSETSMLTRAILATLARYGDTASFDSVVRFLDSDQELEALQCLGRVDFQRTLFFLIQAARRKHLRDVCLHILQGRRKTVGLANLTTELVAYAKSVRSPVRRRLSRVLHCKEGSYNPFSEEEIAVIERALNG
jgi:hypothetical protein